MVGLIEQTGVVVGCIEVGGMGMLGQGLYLKEEVDGTERTELQSGVGLGWTEV